MNKIENLVLRLRTHLGIPDDTLPELVDVLRRLKIAGVITGFGPDENGVLGDIAAMWDPSTRMIILSDRLWERLEGESDSETRFTIFHEIGHAVLDHTARYRKLDGRLQFGRSIEFDEVEADDFALAFAIPLTFAEKADLSDIAKLAEQFGLSPHMADRRKVELQRYARQMDKINRPELDEPEDSYADAMAEMRINALTWNAQSG